MLEHVIEQIKEYCELYGYPVLFGGVMLENAGIPVPGETAVLIAGFMASEAGGHRLEIGLVILVTVLAAVIGDNLGFWLGREWARPRIQAGRRFLFFTPRHLQMAEPYFRKYGSWTIFFARFVTGIRVVGAMAAGTAGMPWPHFLLANGLGAILWATTISLLGYFFGESFELLEKWIGRTGGILLGIFLALAFLYYWHRPKRRPGADGSSSTSEGNPPESQEPH
jgi:membrane protein DedA with SNARE-associated domain